MTRDLHIIMPVKDSIDTTRQAIRAILDSGQHLTVYNDFSTEPNTRQLIQWSLQWGFRLINLSDITSTPSPNYRLILQHAQQHALQTGANLVIVESDVQVRTNTFDKLADLIQPGVGMVAAVTVDSNNIVNFPYEYARRYDLTQVIDTHKRLSFCCTLLTLEFLNAYSFQQLDPDKNWFDVFISHQSVSSGFHNLLMMNNPVLHSPHSSRPWKQLKYSRPLLYYWRKLTQHKDKI